jgi:hypothetical protein
MQDAKIQEKVKKEEAIIKENGKQIKEKVRARKPGCKGAKKIKEKWRIGDIKNDATEKNNKKIVETAQDSTDGNI